MSLLVKTISNIVLQCNRAKRLWSAVASAAALNAEGLRAKRLRSAVALAAALEYDYDYDLCTRGAFWDVLGAFLWPNQNFSVAVRKKRRPITLYLLPERISATRIATKLVRRRGGTAPPPHCINTRPYASIPERVEKRHPSQPPAGFLTNRSPRSPPPPPIGILPASIHLPAPGPSP